MTALQVSQEFRARGNGGLPRRLRRDRHLRILGCEKISLCSDEVMTAYLLCRVKEWKQSLLFADIRYFLPLLFRQVDASGIVRASVKKNYISSGSSLKRRCQSCKVNSFGFCIPVRVFLD